MKKLMVVFVMLSIGYNFISCNKRAKPTIIHGAALTQAQLDFFPFQLNHVYVFKNSTGGALRYTCNYYSHAWEDSSNAPPYCSTCDSYCYYTLSDGLTIQLTSDSLPNMPMHLNIRTSTGPAYLQIACFNTIMQMDWNNTSTCKVGLHYLDVTNTVNCVSEFRWNSVTYTDVVKLEGNKGQSAVQTIYYSPTGGLLQFILNGDVWTLQ